MDRDDNAGNPSAPDGPDGFHRPHVSAAYSISVVSVAWTVVASTASVAIGISSGAAVLVAFGAIGVVDAIGSVALAYHFHHGLRHDELADHLEQAAHRVVLTGLFLVGCAAVIGGVVRLALGQHSKGSDLGVALAALSLVGLTVLSLRKQRIGRQIASPALVSDGHLSGIGAMQAAVTLVGTVAAKAFGWTWADAVATAVLGAVAVTLAVATFRQDHGA